MSRVAVGRSWLAFACLAMSLGFVAVVAPTIAKADDTVWICKPGQTDDLCAGTIDGSTIPPPGQTAEPLGYTRPADPPVDCFYLYPTQSDQATPNSNLDKDPPIRRVVVQQARMFSSVCNVYAPMYRQVTDNGDQSAYNPSVETAYQSAKSAFQDFLTNYNGDRGFIMIGHSQGSAHTARLIDEMVDTDPELRKRFVGAIAPGANIAVPIGQPVGGLFANVPACTTVGQYGCVTAFSTYNDIPGANSEFSRVNTGYWIYPEPRFSSSSYEVMCTDPARIDGGNGNLEPLVNFDYLTGVPPEETASPWAGEPDYYKVECKRQDGAHWLNLSKVDLPGDTRPDLGATVASGSNYHVPEVNLAEGNLLRIARLQTDSYEAEQARIARIERLRARLRSLSPRVARARKHFNVHRHATRRVARKLHRAQGRRLRSALHRRLVVNRTKIRADRRQIRSLRRQMSQVRQQLA